MKGRKNRGRKHCVMLSPSISPVQWSEEQKSVSTSRLQAYITCSTLLQSTHAFTSNYLHACGFRRLFSRITAVIYSQVELVHHHHSDKYVNPGFAHVLSCFSCEDDNNKAVFQFTLHGVACVCRSFVCSLSKLPARWLA